MSDALQKLVNMNSMLAEHEEAQRASASTAIPSSTQLDRLAFLIAKSDRLTRDGMADLAELVDFVEPEADRFESDTSATPLSPYHAVPREKKARNSKPPLMAGAGI